MDPFSRIIHHGVKVAHRFLKRGGWATLRFCPPYCSLRREARVRELAGVLTPRELEVMRLVVDRYT
jgi:hypothetical protein